MEEGRRLVAIRVLLGAGLLLASLSACLLAGGFEGGPVAGAAVVGPLCTVAGVTPNTATVSSNGGPYSGESVSCTGVPAGTDELWLTSAGEGTTGSVSGDYLVLDCYSNGGSFSAAGPWGVVSGSGGDSSTLCRARAYPASVVEPVGTSAPAPGGVGVGTASGYGAGFLVGGVRSPGAGLYGEADFPGMPGGSGPVAYDPTGDATGLVGVLAPVWGGVVVAVFGALLGLLVLFWVWRRVICGILSDGHVIWRRPRGSNV